MFLLSFPNVVNNRFTLMSQLLNSTEDAARPYISSSHEVHPDPTGDGASTLQFFRDNFGFKYE